MAAAKKTAAKKTTARKSTSRKRTVAKDEAVFLSNGKYQRAKAVVLGTRSFKEGNVEQAALDLCKGDGVKGEDALIVCVYRKLGGAIAGDPVETDDKVGEIKVRKEGKEEEVLPDPA